MKIKFIPWNEISTKIERQREQEKTESEKHTKKTFCFKTFAKSNGAEGLAGTEKYD